MYIYKSLTPSRRREAMPTPPADPPTCLSYDRSIQGPFPGSAARNSDAFISKHAFDKNTSVLYGLSRDIAPVTRCPPVTKKDVKYLDRRATRDVSRLQLRELSYEVRAEGTVENVQHPHFRLLPKLCKSQQL